MDDAFGMRTAEMAAAYGTCARRQIGAAVFDATGERFTWAANGPPAALPACIDTPCPAADIPAGRGNAATPCHGVHAEARALRRATFTPHTVYSTKAPCTACTLMLLDTPAQRIVFSVASNETTNRDLWVSAGREWIHHVEGAGDESRIHSPYTASEEAA